VEVAPRHQNFEITIRLLGGLISNYQLTGDKRLLAMADDLGKRLLPVFDSPTGIPYMFVNLKTGKVPLVLFVHPSVPAKDLREFIAYAKAHPGKLNYGSSGPGSSPHLATELLMSLTGMQMTHVPYKGIAPAITAQLADEVQMSFTPIAVGMPHARAGRLRAIGQAGLKRSVAVPDVPTLDESGLPGFEVIGWWGMLAPAKTPRPVVSRLNGEIRAVLELAEVRRNLIGQGMDPADGTPEQFGALIKSDMDKWGDIGKRLGVRLD